MMELQTGQAILTILPMDLSGAGTVVDLKGAGIAFDVAVDPDGVYIDGQVSPMTGFAMRCSKAGACPTTGL